MNNINSESEKYYRQKTSRINNWRFYGVIFDHIDEINYVYDLYLNTDKCNKCEKIFNNSSDKCLDHCHATGKFRSILCRNCNHNYYRSKYKNNKTGFKNIRYSNDKKSYVVEIQQDYIIICKKRFSKKIYTLDDVVLFRNEIYKRYKLTPSYNEKFFNKHYSSEQIKENIEKKLLNI